MGDLIYKTVLTAKKECKQGKLILSLSGGRKTMSADMQEAGNIFGCDAMLHVVNTREINREFQENNLLNIPPSKFSSVFMPIVAFGVRESSPILFLEPSVFDNKKFILNLTNKNYFQIYYNFVLPFLKNYYQV